MHPVRCGKYLLHQRISVGGMAEVFRATRDRDPDPDRLFAIKRILPNVAEDITFIKMFIAEARTTSQLVHPHICEIYELGRSEGTHFIAMEHIWGKDLLQIRNRQRTRGEPMPIQNCAFILSRVLEGLDYAHRKRDPLGRSLELVHRDLSPHNVLLSYKGEVKVIDFGVAKVKSRLANPNEGQIKGKFAYMSPEQVRGKPLDRRSDIFAVGTVLYECLTGERLFTGDTDLSIVEKVREAEIPSVRIVVPNLPDEMERILLKALAKEADERYQWCAEMAADLAPFAEGVDAGQLSVWLEDLFAAEIAIEQQQIDEHVHGKPPAPRAPPTPTLQIPFGEPARDSSDITQSGAPTFDDPVDDSVED